MSNLGICRSFDFVTALVIPEWTRGDRMRKARENKGIGVQEMARLMVRGRSTIRNYESDATKPPPHVIRKWAELCEVPTEWLDVNIAQSVLDGETPGDQLALLDNDAQAVRFDYRWGADVVDLTSRRAS